MNRLAIERLIKEQMPLAKAMDVRVVRLDENHVELTCPLAPNHNHLGSAFGGSLSTLMILAAYCRLFYMIDDTGHVLLKSSSYEFFTPVHEELKAVCQSPSLEAREAFLNAYRKKGRARLTLTSEILLKDGTIAARMIGEFVGRGTT